jgi:hypothetical protein
MGVGDEVVRVGIVLAQAALSGHGDLAAVVAFHLEKLLRRIELGALPELGAGIPERTRDEVLLPVPVEVADPGALRQNSRVSVVFLKPMSLWDRAAAARGTAATVRTRAARGGSWRNHAGVMAARSSDAARPQG